MNPIELWPTLHEVLTIIGLTVSFLWMALGLLGGSALLWKGWKAHKAGKKNVPTKGGKTSWKAAWEKEWETMEHLSIGSNPSPPVSPSELGTELSTGLALGTEFSPSKTPPVPSFSIPSKSPRKA